MNGELKRELLAELDKYVIEKQMSNSDTKIAEVIKPELERMSKEHNVDMVDLFVEYMDHVARSSKRMAAEAGDEIDMNKLDIKLY